LSRVDSSVSITLYFTLSCLTVSALLLPFAFTVPNWFDLSLLVLIGIAGGVAQLCQSYAYKLAPAAAIAPFDYTEMVWAVLIGMLVWNETPTFSISLGAGLIVVTGLITMGAGRAPRVEPSLAQSQNPTGSSSYPTK
jgi:drug/metabolite transporter (DMT)-like permease